MKKFIGRCNELKKLNNLMSQNKACITVIKGRRRIGKSRLVSEFAKDKLFLSFSGIPPQKNVTAKDQRNAFTKQLQKYSKQQFNNSDDWVDIFDQLTTCISTKPTVILFDEISWMGSKDPTFLGKIKNWWDLVLQNKANLMLVFCGSVSTWINANIINSTAFFGRISLYITLSELPLKEAYKFLQTLGVTQSIYDCYKLLSVVGGVPWYLEQIIPNQTVDDNIKRLCFESDGLLVKEFDRIFYDLFLGKGEIYEKIVHLLASGMMTLSQIREKLSYPQSGKLSQYMNDLEVSGYITQHPTWNLKTGKIGKQKIFRLNDNYLRFYIKYIEPNLQRLPLNSMPGWESIIGIQLETLLLNNRKLLKEAIGIQTSDVVLDNPYIQKSSTKHKGCQIDYLIQTRSNNLFLCEFKLRKHELNTNVIDEMQKKVKALSIPRGFGVCSVLFHLSGVTPSVFEHNYFYKIIDLHDLITTSFEA